MDSPADFWQALDRLLAASDLVIDRPQGLPSSPLPAHGL